MSSFNLGALAGLPQIPRDVSRLNIQGIDIPLPSVACADQNEAMDVLMGVNSLPGNQKALLPEGHAFSLLFCLIQCLPSSPPFFLLDTSD